MKTKRIIILIAALVVASAFALAPAQETKEEKPTQGTMATPGPDGTWRLVKRVLPDSTVLTPPDVNGLMTFSNGYRNLNVASRDHNGLVFCRSAISKVKMTDSTYTETALYGFIHDEMHGQPVKYIFEEQTKTVPVKRDGSKISFKLPFDPPTVVLDGDKMTATLEGQFVDVWERVK